MNTTPDAVWQTYGDRIRRFVAARVHHAHDADDLLQDVFSKIQSGLTGLENPDKVEAWVFQVTRRTIVDHYRRRSSEPRTQAEAIDPAEALPEPEVAAEIASWLKPMMEQLPARDREALELTDLQGLGQQEVADRLGLSFSGAKSRIQRARTRLKEVLLECCDVSLDRRGNALEYSPRRASCACESCR